MVLITATSHARALSVKREHDQTVELVHLDTAAAHSNGQAPHKRIKTEAKDEPQVIELSDDDETSTNPRPSANSRASASTSAVPAVHHDEQDLQDELHQLEIEKRRLQIQKKLRDMQRAKGKAKANIKLEDA